MVSIYKEKSKSTGKRRCIYRCKVKDPTTGKWISRSTKSYDKQVAGKFVMDLQIELDRKAAGIIVPEKRKKFASKPMLEHLDDFLNDLKTRGRSSGYLSKLKSRIPKLAKECRWKHVRDVDNDSFLRWRNKQNKAPKTLNDYLDAMNGLLRWMIQNERLDHNPLEHVGKVEVRGRRTFERRPFTFTEMQRLLAVSGPRSIVYLTAVCTGLRRNELRLLEFGDLRLDVSSPYLLVRSSTTKNKKHAHIPLVPELVKALQKHVAKFNFAKPNRLLFKLMVPRMATFKKDLKRAGIVYIDERGHHADFHALRHTLCTNLEQFK